MFKIVSVGWQCAQFLDRTLQSVAEQTCSDYKIMVVYDPSTDDGALKVWNWCDRDPERRHFLINLKNQKFAVQNQYAALKALDPADDDIIVFLDLDGDQLAHPNVLAHLLEYYADGTLLTYGNYQPVPHVTTCPPAVPFPPQVVHDSSYRQYILSGAGSCFNHLRTMKGRVWKAIPEAQFKWSDRDEWFENGTDYVFMTAGLELAAGRYKCIEEVLCLYNHDNPLADNITHPASTHSGVQNLLNRPPLSALPY